MSVFRVCVATWFEAFACFLVWRALHASGLRFFWFGRHLSDLGVCFVLAVGLSRLFTRAKLPHAVSNVTVPVTPPALRSRDA